MLDKLFNKPKYESEIKITLKGLMDTVLNARSELIEFGTLYDRIENLVLNDDKFNSLDLKSTNTINYFLSNVKNYDTLALSLLNMLNETLTISIANDSRQGKNGKIRKENIALMDIDDLEDEINNTNSIISKVSQNPNKIRVSAEEIHKSVEKMKSLKREIIHFLESTSFMVNNSNSSLTDLNDNNKSIDSTNLNDIHLPFPAQKKRNNSDYLSEYPNNIDVNLTVDIQDKVISAATLVTNNSIHSILPYLNNYQSKMTPLELRIPSETKALEGEINEPMINPQTNSESGKINYPKVENLNENIITQNQEHSNYLSFNDNVTIRDVIYQDPDNFYQVGFDQKGNLAAKSINNSDTSAMAIDYDGESDKINIITENYKTFTINNFKEKVQVYRHNNQPKPIEVSKRSNLIVTAKEESTPLNNLKDVKTEEVNEFTRSKEILNTDPVLESEKDQTINSEELNNEIINKADLLFVKNATLKNVIYQDPNNQYQIGFDEDSNLMAKLLGENNTNAVAISYNDETDQAKVTIENDKSFVINYFSEKVEDYRIASTPTLELINQYNKNSIELTNQTNTSTLIEDQIIEQTKELIPESENETIIPVESVNYDIEQLQKKIAELEYQLSKQSELKAQNSIERKPTQKESKPVINSTKPTPIPKSQQANQTSSQTINKPKQRPERINQNLTTPDTLYNFLNNLYDKPIPQNDIKETADRIMGKSKLEKLKAKYPSDK